ncbi:DUF3048 domain-containing protein [Blastococcus tunisiensis]|uniref:DUF3048 domain-containing protein n=1 Tax=Blastococcus tunisiensis TaxID=1798228 RepID=A0A1I2B0X3_9ACTN|nr:DUF3048 domain-containing protein [Blastococcus sp. DSM 46838]SFE49716.1 Protein of unknown function [Blastococcus sp. DSM 46838]
MDSFPVRTTRARPARRRRLGTALFVALVLGASVACGTDPVTPTASTPTPTPPPPPPPPPPVYWPLTGIESGAVADHPALAVKIENSTDSRPQTGLNSADVVWEEVVEGGITRFVAVYHSTMPTEIGPIRSVRPMDPAIAAPLRGLFAFSGGQRPFVDAVADAGLQVISHDAGDAGFYRLSTRSAPHNVYADTTAFLAQADAGHQVAPAPQFSIAPPGQQPTAPATGVPTTVLNLKLSGVGRPTWTWHAPAAAWHRAEGGTPATEADGSPLRAANVVVLRVAVVNTGFSDPAGNPVPETQMVGSGEALIATGGATVAATWSKASLDAPVVLTDAAGLTVQLAPGNTWVELVPTRTGSVTVG